MLKPVIPAVPPNVRRAFRTRLVAWFGRHRRALPWRRKRTPYRVWISELMLQQTRTDQALPYFRRFMNRFPTLRALARASRRDVLKTWEGLGYYARARNAHDTARFLARHRGGRFPKTYEDLRALPGVGPYTAAAVGSLALGLDVAVVDGNVARVLSRVMAFGGDLSTARSTRALKAWAQHLLIPGRAGLSNEAVMELGATVCTPRHPKCGVCPLRSVCRALAAGRPESYPRPRKRKPLPHKVVGAAIVVNRKGEILIARRKETSMLGGLWEFPGGTLERGESMRQCIARELREELGLRVRVGPRLLVVHHAYSHFTIDLHVHWARIMKGRPRVIHCAEVAWVSTKDLRRYPFSRADVKIIEVIERLGFPYRATPAKLPFQIQRKWSQGWGSWVEESG